MKDKTIKEIAEELVVSKQAVWQKIKNESSIDLRQFTSTKGNKVYVSAKGNNIIKSMFINKNSHKSSTENNNYKSHVDDSELTFLRALVLDLQEDKKDLHKLLDQQQQLTLQSNKRNDQLEAQLQIETQKNDNEEGFISPCIETLSDPPPAPEKNGGTFSAKNGCLVFLTSRYFIQKRQSTCLHFAS